MSHKHLLMPMASLLVFVAGCAGTYTDYSDPGPGCAPMPYTGDISRRPGGEPSLIRLDENPSLSDYLAYAALNNPGLEAAFNRWKAALQRIPQAKSLPDPRFTYRYYIKEVETRVGPQKQALALSQTFPWFGKLASKGDSTTQAARTEQMRYEVAKLRLFYDVTRAYHEYYYLICATEIMRQNVELTRMLTQVAMKRYSVSAAGHPDIIRAQVELATLEDRLRTLEDLKHPTVARLNAALGRRAEEEVQTPSVIETRQMDLRDSQLEAMLLANNPELSAMAADVARGRADVAVARKEGYPEFTVGIDVIQTDKAQMGNPTDNGKDPVIASVMLSLPVWRQKVNAGLNEARHRYSAAIGMKTDRTNQLAADLKLASYGYRDARRRESLYADTLLPKARESFNVTQKAYQTGQSSFSDLIDAQRVLLEFELEYERARADGAERLAEIKMLVGGDI